MSSGVLFSTHCLLSLPSRPLQNILQISNCPNITNQLTSRTIQLNNKFKLEVLQKWSNSGSSLASQQPSQPLPLPTSSKYKTSLSTSPSRSPRMQFNLAPSSNTAFPQLCSTARASCEPSFAPTVREFTPPMRHAARPTQLPQHEL